jgi:adenylate kinase
MKCFAFLGIQGSGKGTQAVQLSAELKYQHINIGDLFRYHIKKKTPIGAKVQQIIQRGELVPDEVVFELVKASTDAKAKGIVFDGFPRTIAQAEYLLKHYDLRRVFYLELSEATAVNRISARRVCQNCQENYNLNTQPPKISGICDECGGKLIIRQDDKPEAIHKRFEEFYEQTLPLKDFFKKNGLLSDVSGEQPIAEIFNQILSVTASQK